MACRRDVPRRSQVRTYPQQKARQTPFDILSGDLVDLLPGVTKTRTEQVKSILDKVCVSSPQTFPRVLIP
ncbi:hypothetical protein DEVEQU_00152 [Devosia equisanguinis]|uniref:Uncharacterized protein n=1 Tax=Devosia equisanguinis TaxID=2490941 RepID=A0A3S4CAW0_9HYPH|nr:hypothetical protein DEVEQU_00152 [Devosia equisanguinis]